MTHIKLATERLQFRVNSEIKKSIQLAASILRVNVTDFVTQTAMKEAQRVINENESPKLSYSDKKLILDLLDNPPKPNDKLKAAAISASKNFQG
ncbi:DUF1778 domain-containing protein [Xenorhabdus nematophila]|uniref:type II toxin-antitoxin system TacA family antitoxin n=1 Tax=Xenorhabdus nematophila TaxID=628 RepID=UPI0032B81F4B